MANLTREEFLTLTNTASATMWAYAYREFGVDMLKHVPQKSWIAVLTLLGQETPTNTPALISRLEYCLTQGEAFDLAATLDDPESLYRMLTPESQAYMELLAQKHLLVWPKQVNSVENPVLFDWLASLQYSPYTAIHVPLDPSLEKLRYLIKDDAAMSKAYHYLLRTPDWYVSPHRQNNIAYLQKRVDDALAKNGTYPVPGGDPWLPMMQTLAMGLKLLAGEPGITFPELVKTLQGKVLSIEEKVLLTCYCEWHLDSKATLMAYVQASPAAPGWVPGYHAIVSALGLAKGDVALIQQLMTDATPQEHSHLLSYYSARNVPPSLLMEPYLGLAKQLHSLVCSHPFDQIGTAVENTEYCAKLYPMLLVHFNHAIPPTTPIIDMLGISS